MCALMYRQQLGERVGAGQHQDTDSMASMHLHGRTLATCKVATHVFRARRKRDTYSLPHSGSNPFSCELMHHLEQQRDLYQVQPLKQQRETPEPHNSDPPALVSLTSYPFSAPLHAPSILCANSFSHAAVQEVQKLGRCSN